MNSLSFLLWLQSLRTPLADSLAIGASSLGSEEAYLIVLTTIYLCVGHRLGFHMFVVFLLSVFVNSELKLLFATERPYVMYPEQLHPLYAESGGGYAFPSGHSQGAAAIGGILSVRAGGRWTRAALLLVVAAIAFSRLYLGVHWPADVIGGLLIGGALVLGYLVLLGAWAAAGRDLGFTLPLLLILMGSAAIFGLGYGEGVCVRTAGVLLGSGVGYLLLERRGGYKAQAPPWTQVAKVLVAVVVLLGLRTGLKLVLGEAPWANAARYAVIGLTSAYLLPLLFCLAYNLRKRWPRYAETLQQEDE